MMTDGFLFRAGLLFITKYDEKLIKEGKRIHFNQAYLDDFNKNDVPKNNIVIFNFEADDLEAEYERIKNLSIGEVSDILCVNCLLYTSNTDVYWELMDDIRTEQISCLTRERWKEMQGVPG